MKKALLIFLLLLAFLVPVRAQEVDVKSIAVRDTVLPGQDAEFLVSIMSHINSQVSLSYSDDYWRAKIEPNAVNLISGKSYENIKINLFPLSNAKPGNYIFKLRVVALPEYRIIVEHPIIIVLADKDNAVNVDVLTSALEPGLKENLLQIGFENNYNIDIPGLKAIIESKLFTHDVIIDLAGREKKIEDIIVNLDRSIEEGSYDVDVKLAINNIQLATIKKSIQVGKIADLKRSISFAGGLFTSVKEVSFVNEGNGIVKDSYSENIGLLEDIFTATNPGPDFVESKEEGRILGWDVELNPGESKTIAVTTGYRGFVIFVILLLVGIGILWVVLGKEIMLTKKVTHATSHHDAFGSMRVGLNIRNRGKHRMYNVRVMDKVPAYVSPMEEEFSGLHPESVKKADDGAVLVWNIPSMDAGSEYAISYRIKSKLPVFGKVTLPGAVAKYRNSRGKIVNSYSNKMLLFGLQGHSE